MKHTRQKFTAVIALVLTATLAACGGGNDAKGADAAAKATGKLVSNDDFSCDLFKDVDLRSVLPTIDLTDRGSSRGCTWESNVGTGNNGSSVDTLSVRLEDGIPATYEDYIEANGLAEINENKNDYILATDPGDADHTAEVLKGLKAEGWTYGFQFGLVASQENNPKMAYFYDEDKGHGLSCTYTPQFPNDRFPDDEYFSSHPGKLVPWLDEMQPKVLAVCSELMAAARS